VKGCARPSIGRGSHLVSKYSIDRRALRPCARSHVCPLRAEIRLAVACAMLAATASGLQTVARIAY
jgi:hypothetical protein